MAGERSAPRLGLFFLDTRLRRFVTLGLSSSSSSPPSSESSSPSSPALSSILIGRRSLSRRRRRVAVRGRARRLQQLCPRARRRRPRSSASRLSSAPTVPPRASSRDIDPGTPRVWCELRAVRRRPRVTSAPAPQRQSRKGRAWGPFRRRMQTNASRSHGATIVSTVRPNPVCCQTTVFARRNCGRPVCGEPPRIGGTLTAFPTDGGSHVQGTGGSRVVAGRRCGLRRHATRRLSRRTIDDGRCARRDGLRADRRLLGLEGVVALGEEGSRDEADALGDPVGRRRDLFVGGEQGSGQGEDERSPTRSRARRSPRSWSSSSRSSRRPT